MVRDNGFFASVAMVLNLGIGLRGVLLSLAASHLRLADGGLDPPIAEFGGVLPCSPKSRQSFDLL